jgi:hypothetical protein
MCFENEKIILSSDKKKWEIKIKKITTWKVLMQTLVKDK